MFATWDLAVEQISENLAKGETSIDVKRAIADAMLPAQLLGTHAGLVLPQNANDLLFAETAFPHRLSPRLENRLTSNRGLFRGAGQKYWKDNSTSDEDTQNELSRQLAEYALNNQQAAEFNALAKNFARYASNEYRVRCNRIFELVKKRS